MENKPKLKALFYPDVKFETLFIPYIYQEIYLDGLYVDIFNTKSDMVVLDVGANIGIVTDYMRPYCKKLYAIEPAEQHFAALKKNKEYNEWDNVEIFKLALADKDGEMTLNLNEHNRTCNSLTLDYGQGGETVETMRIDTFLDKNNIEKVDFMKFDVEGAEDMILRSAGFQKVVDRIDAIEVEFHHPNWNELAKYMMELGYKARRYDSSAIVLLFSK